MPRTPAKRAVRPPSTQPHDLVLRVVLREIEPPIWRQLGVPAEFTLDQLHRTLQLVFAWQDYHLHQFEIGARRFEAPDPEAEGESTTGVRLEALGLRAGDTFLYRYDFGDDWEHEIVVAEVVPRADPEGDRWPVLLDGARAGPPEDCGGPHGFMELLATLERPRSRACRELRAWLGPSYHPAVFDQWQVGHMLTLAAAYGAV